MQKKFIIILGIGILMIFLGNASRFIFKANEIKAPNTDALNNTPTTTVENPIQESQLESTPKTPAGNQGIKPPAVIESPTIIEPTVITPPPEAPKKTGDLVLYNIGVNLEEYSPATNKAGDFLFTKTIGDHYSNKALLEFGAELTGPGGTDVMPHPTYFLPRGTKVFSPVNGKVEDVRSQAESNDYELVIVPDGFSSWRISLDHIINVLAKKGDIVETGDIIGQVAPSNSSAVPPELGWVELQVWKESSFFWQREMLATCPFLLLEEGKKQDIALKITKLAEDWENFLGKDVYKQEKWVSPGCLQETAPA